MEKKKDTNNSKSGYYKILKKQKQLTEHFKYLYTLLEEIKPQSASNITIKQLIGNTIDCVSSNKCEGRNDVYSYERSDTFTLGEVIKLFLKIYYLKCLTYLIVII